MERDSVCLASTLPWLAINSLREITGALLAVEGGDGELGAPDLVNPAYARMMILNDGSAGSNNKGSLCLAGSRRPVTGLV